MLDLGGQVCGSTFRVLPHPYKIKIFLTHNRAQSAKIDLNKKSLLKQKTIQNFTFDAQGFRKTRNENPPTLEIVVTS